MGKYNLPLDLDTDNSLSMIIKHIKRGSRVLEFGPAEGRLTRYLHEELGCSLDIVEIDAESGGQAAAFADIACLGEAEGDIERGIWLEKVRGRNYDYIIFADVLEHLRNPERALRHCVDLLADGGELLTSVPNIAHNAIIIGLMLGKFQYTPTGLLDNTHIHFFTYESFCQMAETAGWQVLGAETAMASLGHMEQPYDYTMVPKAVGKALKLREAGNVYQYVFRLGRKDGRELTQSRNLRMQSDYVCECYIKSGTQAEWSPGLCISRELRGIGEGTSFDISFDVSDFEDIKGLRLDPLNASCVLELGRIELKYEDHSEVVEPAGANGAYIDGSYVFATDDPQFLVNVAEGKLCQVVLSFKVLFFDEAAVGIFQKWLIDMQVRMETQLEAQKAQMEVKQAELASAQGQILALQQQINELHGRGLWRTIKDFIRWH